MSMRPRTMLFDHDFPVKLDMAAAEECLDDGLRLSKRSRLSPIPSPSQWNDGVNELSAASLQYNPLDEPKPLGLRLRKSPSLLELIEMRLSTTNALPLAAVPDKTANNMNEKDVKGNATSGASDKLSLKALNFNASSLRIGSWEFISRHEGDLVAKCYFAKKKLVWEVLEGGLKSKVEIQWADIIGLKANCPDDSPGTLTIVLARRPLFSKETNPQPRKHTLWQASSDFTDGQASSYRTHVLQCPPGVLNKHYEKLLQSDARLNLLNQQQESLMDSPCFDVKTSLIRNPDERSCFELFNEASPISSFHDGASPSMSEPYDTVSVNLSRDASSANSGIDANVVEGNSYGNQPVAQTLKNVEQRKIGGLRQSMSMTDLMSHIGQQISEGVISGSIPSAKAAECQDMLDNVAQILLSDTQNIAASDERLMKKVNSLCCLLELDSAPPPENRSDAPTTGSDAGGKWEIAPSYDNSNLDYFQPPSIQRKDSFGDFLLNLPRISSFPKFLFDIEEASENHFK